MWTDLFQVLAAQTHLSEELAKIGLTICPRTAAPSTAGCTTRGPTSTILAICTLHGRQSVHTTAGDTDRNESISNLPHDDSPVRTACYCCADSSEFSFPVRANLVFVSMEDKSVKGEVERMTHQL